MNMENERMNYISDSTGPLKFARCAEYLRYSTNVQRPASLEDQDRSSMGLADQKGCQVLNEHIYKDKALSGTSRAGRNGLQALLAAAQLSPRPFEYVLIDDTSRLGRDVGDVLAITEELKMPACAVDGSWHDLGNAELCPPRASRLQSCCFRVASPPRIRRQRVFDVNGPGD